MSHAFITIHHTHIAYRLGNSTGSNPGNDIECLAAICQHLQNFHAETFEIRDERVLDIKKDLV